MMRKINELFQWWLKGLLIPCPAFLYRAMQPKINRLVINVNEKEVIAKYYNNDSTVPAATDSFNIDNEIDRAATLKFINEKKKNNASIILALPDNILLQRTLVLPAAVKSNLRQALGFELNRKTPFTAEQAYYDYVVTDSNDKLNIDLFIAPRNRVDPILENMELLGIGYDTVSFEQEEKVRTELNLVTGEDDTNANSEINKLTALLATASLVLMLTTLYLPVYTQSNHLETLEAEVKKKRKDAVELQSLIKEKNIIFEQSHFLSRKRAEQISSIELINEITRVIPDDTWLNRLIIKSGEIQVQGESANASALIQAIETSELFSNAQFRSPITKNNLTQKDRFNLSANISKGSAS